MIRYAANGTPNDVSFMELIDETIDAAVINLMVPVAKYFNFKFVKGIVNVLLVLTFGDLSVDGRVCFCNTDLCAAGGCGDGKVGILGYWLVLWIY